MTAPGYHAAHREERNAYNRDWFSRRDLPSGRTRSGERNFQMRQRDRALALAAYGGKCTCCGESDSRFLTIDHINGGGSQHRREIGQGKKLVTWLRQRKWPSGYQILCWNCNCGREFNGGVCPHQQPIERENLDD